MRRSMGRRGNNNGGGNGPLMTGHLQDLDLELELLKRKRDMIEQQQQLLVMEQQFQTSRHSYDQMLYDEPVQHGSIRDFAHLYETGSKNRTQFGRKRQAENQWQFDSAPKRTAQKKKNQSPFYQHGSGKSGSGNFRAQKPYQGQGFNQGSRSSPRAPAPLMDVKIPKLSIGQKIAKQKAPPKPPKKDFTLSKVTKPKAPPAPNKLESRTTAERKSLVAAASASSDADVSRMLLPDRVPTQQVSGRLELALGAIMKNIRTLITGQPEHASVLRSMQLQRVMKQAVRERIRTVMLGKVVGSLIEILAVYREEFPEETDADIVNIALEASGISAPVRKPQPKFIKSEDPGEFFKANMNTLLEIKLNEMFSKLEEIYGNAAANDAPSEEQTDIETQKDLDQENNKEGGLDNTKESDIENTKESEVENTKESEEQNTNESEVENTKESEVENTKESEVENTKESEVENTNESEVENTNENEVENTNENEVESTKEMEIDSNKEIGLENNKDSEIENNEESGLGNNKESELENNKGSEIENNKEGGLENNKDSIVNKEIYLQKNVSIDLVKSKEECNKNRENTQEYKDFLNSTIKVYDVKRVIPKIIKRYVPYIVKLLNMDMVYQSTKAAITQKANEKAAKLCSPKRTEQGPVASTNASTPATPNGNRQMYNLPYYVKIMGRPSLPKRKVMQSFLTQYNPQSIKKHRTIHNLLFVGFNEKSDYDVMVAADGTIVGRSTLSIRVCSKPGPRESNGENNESNDVSLANNVSQREIKTENQKDIEIISPELDDQITDLLSSIRKSEEEETTNKENGEATEMNDGAEPKAEVKMEGEENINNDENNAVNKENIDENMTDDNQEEMSEAANETETQKEKVDNGTEVPEITEDLKNNEKSQESSEAGNQNPSEKTPTKADEQSDDKVGDLKSNATGRSTPSRMSSRLANATPSTIRTRRASRLASQN